MVRIPRYFRLGDELGPLTSIWCWSPDGVLRYPAEPDALARRVADHVLGFFAENPRLGIVEWGHIRGMYDAASANVDAVRAAVAERLGWLDRDPRLSCDRVGVRPASKGTA